MHWPTIPPIVPWLSQKETIDAEQLQSPFFRIPLEIRRLIYAYAVSYSHTQEGNTSKDVPDLHIVTIKKDKKSWLTNARKETPVLCHCRCKQLDGPCMPKCWLVSTCWESNFGDWNLLSLALTCQRMYERALQTYTSPPTNAFIPRSAESLPYLYTQQTFRFGSLTTLTRFASTIPSTHFTSSIHRLRLDWTFCEIRLESYGAPYTVTAKAPIEESGWDEVCDEILLKMRGLRELWVRFIRDDWTREAVWEGGIFEGVKRVAEGRGDLGRFEVDVNWQVREETMEMMGKYPGVKVRVALGLKRSEFYGTASSQVRRVE